MPDPRHGVFETLLVIDGRPVELEAHLNRLAESLRALFPTRPRPEVREAIETSATELGHGSIRATVTPTGSATLEAQVESRSPRGAFLPISGSKAPHTVGLCSLTVAGGLGAHKWADRSLINDAQSELPADTLPLIVDSDGAVLEASRANVFAIRKGALFTPPLDDRILPGVTRARVLEIAAGLGVETHETTLGHDELLAADEVFLTGSVRGVEPVVSIDGENVAAPGKVTSALAAELRRLWLGAPVA